MDYSPGYDKTRVITQNERNKYTGCIGGIEHIPTWENNIETCLRCERPFKVYPDREARHDDRAAEYIGYARADALGWDDEQALNPNIDPDEDHELYYDGKSDEI